MIGDPWAAPPRTDLPFLRRRSRPRPAPAQPDARPASPPHAVERPPTSPGIDYTHPGRRSQLPEQPAASSSLDLSAPGPSAPGPSAPGPSAPGPSAPGPRGVDYTHRGRSTTPPARTPAPDADPPAGPASTGPSTVPGRGLLDLSEPSLPATPARPAAPARSAPRVYRDVRLSGREVRVLRRNAPTVTLTRIQSGVGELRVEAVTSAEAGDLRLGALYQLRSGGSSTVQLAGGHRFAPPSARRPVLVASRDDEYDRISLDLRQIHDVERVVVYAFSESRATLTWGGTLVLSTFAGGRVELPLESLHPGKVAVLMSLYNFDGELVVRGEMETIAGDVRDAARAYGFDRITWRDDRTPVD